MGVGNNDGLLARVLATVFLVSPIISSSASFAEIDPDSGLTRSRGLGDCARELYCLPFSEIYHVTAGRPRYLGINDSVDAKHPRLVVI